MRAFLVALGVLGVGSAASAAETITYTYDVHGQVTKVKHSGTVNDNLESNYEYDKAENRTRKKVDSPPPGG
jgi:hypothetical protein